MCPSIDDCRSQLINCTVLSYVDIHLSNHKPHMLSIGFIQRASELIHATCKVGTKPATNQFLSLYWSAVLLKSNKAIVLQMVRYIPK